MSLCAPDVLAKGYWDLDGVMINFGKWLFDNEFTPSGEMFDVGGGDVGLELIPRHTSTGKTGSPIPERSDRGNRNRTILSYKV